MPNDVSTRERNEAVAMAGVRGSDRRNAIADLADEAKDIGMALHVLTLAVLEVAHQLEVNAGRDI